MAYSIALLLNNEILTDAHFQCFWFLTLQSSYPFNVDVQFANKQAAG